MSYFRGSCNNILMSFLFLSAFFLVLGAPAAMAARENPLVDFSSRDELVKMAGYGEEKLSTVLISGTLVCSSCSHDNKAQTDPGTVSGALVAVSCQGSGKITKPSWVEGSTDEFGDFLVDLPSHLHAIPNLDKRCVVKVLRMPRNSLCYPSFTGKQTGLRLSSLQNGIRIYSAETIYLTPKPLRECTNRVDIREGGASVKAY
ncbi:hypothetical protein NMG60_11009981 [Bertholletia excelsa]